MIKNTVIYKTVNGRDLSALIYTPDKCANPAPVCFWFHGGGFIMGDVFEPDYNSATRNHLLENGFKIISCEYRLCNENTHYDSLLEDCSDFLRYFTRHGEEFGIDLNRCIFAGTSAGAHISLYEGLAGWEFGSDRSEAFPHPKVIVDYCGSTDMTDLADDWDESTFTSIFMAFFGSEYRNPELIEYLSPLYAAKKLPVSDLPSIVAVHGDEDSMINPKQPRKLKAYYDSVGADFKLIAMKNAGHGLSDEPDRPKAEPSREEFSRMVSEYVMEHIQ